MGHVGHTYLVYLPISDNFYTMSINLVQFLLRYLPTLKSEVLYEHSLTKNFDILPEIIMEYQIWD